MRNLLLVVFLIFSVSPLCVVQAAEENTPDFLGVINSRLSVFNGLTKPPGGIVMLGDSLIQIGEWQELLNLPGTLVRNRGVFGQTTQQLLSDTYYIPPMKADQIFIMTGLQELRDQPADEVAKGVTTLVARLRKQSPESQLFVQSLLPVSDKHQTGISNEAIVAVNNALSSYCEAEDNGCRYIDLHSSFLGAEGQQLNPHYTTDGVHLHAAGYLLWAKLLQPFLP